MLPSAVPFFLRSDILQLLATLYRFCCLQTVFCFLHFYLVLVPASYSSLCLSLVSLSLSPHSPQALSPSPLTAPTSLSPSQRGEPGPKGDPGEEDDWVSSSPALTSRPLPWTLRRLYGVGQPIQILFATWSPGRALPGLSPCSLPPCPSPVGQGQPYKQTHTLCLRHCLCLLSAALAGQVTLLLPPGWFGLTQSRLHALPP